MNSGSFDSPLSRGWSRFPPRHRGHRRLPVVPGRSAREPVVLEVGKEVREARSCWRRSYTPTSSYILLHPIPNQPPACAAFLLASKATVCSLPGSSSTKDRTTRATRLGDDTRETEFGFWTLFSGSGDVRTIAVLEGYHTWLNTSDT